VSHKVPIIRKYVQELSFSRISLELHKHGIVSMARYLRHFALVMILEDQGLTSAQMQSVIGISENLLQQYQKLYAELNVPAYARTLDRLKRIVFRPLAESELETRPTATAPTIGEKGGQP
jgi:hypothetical protein